MGGSYSPASHRLAVRSSLPPIAARFAAVFSGHKSLQTSPNLGGGTSLSLPRTNCPCISRATASEFPNGECMTTPEPTLQTMQLEFRAAPERGTGAGQPRMSAAYRLARGFSFDRFRGFFHAPQGGWRGGLPFLQSPRKHQISAGRKAVVCAPISHSLGFHPGQRGGNVRPAKLLDYRCGCS